MAAPVRNKSTSAPKRDDALPVSPGGGPQEKPDKVRHLHPVQWGEGHGELPATNMHDFRPKPSAVAPDHSAGADFHKTMTVEQSEALAYNAAVAVNEVLDKADQPA